ncbi:MAG: DUF2945 domain-containing protein [Planctomycetales bacterium]|nr:DUF2945 domain-containing protein [Planctomycetales bacterium]
MAAKLRVGSPVKWKWGQGWGRGTIVERFTEKVTRHISGSDVTRNASDDEPAFLIEQEDGDRVLKSEGELERDS